MADIKIKTKGTVKALDKTINTSTRIKNNIVSTKNKIDNTYTLEEENEIEYASNKISNSIYTVTNKGSKLFNEYGQKAVNESAKNINNGIVRVKAFKNKIAKKKENEVLQEKATKTIKNSFQSSGKYIKTSKQTNVKAIKTSKNLAINTEQSTNTSVKASQKALKKMKVVTEKGLKATKNTMKSFIRTIKMLIAATKNLITFLIAGGWIVLMIIIVICMIGFLVTSVFGIFFTNEYDANSKSMVQVISELNTEFMNKITTIQQENPHDEYDISGSRADWKEILSIYVAKYSNGDYHTEMMSLDDKKIEEIKKIFWDMNEVTFSKDVTTQQQVIVHATWTEYKTITHTKLHIQINNKSTETMSNHYHFNKAQREQLAELLKDDYISMWAVVISGSTGSTDIVSVAESQLGNVGGQPYWSWYGFSSRVEWCATFVSWCANQCGYIENGIIPKFASCESEGVAWFKACGLWQNGGYTPKPGDIIFFDWADKHDGNADHVGIVKKVEGGKVYTIEGNSNDSCKERSYDINSAEIQGYGTPMY